jgi:hypothetical protein
MKREDNGSQDDKNDETSQSIAAYKSISGIDDYDCMISHSANLEEDNNSLPEIENSQFIGFPSILEDDEINENHLYFIRDENNPNNQINNINNINQLQKFKVSRNKRGRKKKEIVLNKKRKEKVHNKYGKDNLLRKCQVSYFNFMIDFANILISSFNYKMRLNPKRKFIPIDYDIKKIVNRNQKIKIHTNSIEDMIKNNISKKHSKSTLTSNRDLCEEIKLYGIPEIEKIFKKNFIFLFDIYYKSNRKINLKELDESLSNLTIEIPETVELYKDMLNKNRADSKFKEYKALMENYIKNYFVCSNLFCTKV